MLSRDSFVVLLLLALLVSSGCSSTVVVVEAAGDPSGVSDGMVSTLIETVSFRFTGPSVVDVASGMELCPFRT